MERLDAYIQAAIKHDYGVVLSRAYIERLLEIGGVILNNEVIKKKGFKFDSSKLKPVLQKEKVDQIIQEYQKGYAKNVEAQEWHEGTIDQGIDEELVKSAGDIKPNILYEDDNLLVVFKPAGLLSHPGRGDENGDTMVYRFIKYMRDVHKYVPRAGLLHRLDKETEGILLFAKNMETYNLVKRDFELRRVHKYYFAIGEMTPRINSVIKRKLAEARKEDTLSKFFDLAKQANLSAEEFISKLKEFPSFELEGYIGPVRGSKAMRFDTNKDILNRNNVKMAKECDSNVVVLGEKDEQVYYIVMPVTGRTHQIRAQLHFWGTPIRSDRIYGKRDTPRGILKLLSGAIEFTLKDKKYHFSVPNSKINAFLG
jgi:23S rRNA-/tRNA-specific pseudouridylate synthase